MTVDLQDLSDALLEWLADNDGVENYVRIKPFLASTGVPTSPAFELSIADDLESRGMVKAANDMEGADLRLTARGMQQGRQYRDRRNDLVARGRSCRAAMLRWLFTQEELDSPPSDWKPFEDSEQAYMGVPFRWQEIIRAVADLFERGLIVARTRSSGIADGVLHPRLTPDGRDCVADYGGSVTDFQQRRSGVGPSYQFSDVSGAITVNSSNVSQTVSHGIDTRAAIKFAQGFAQMLPVLDGIPADEHDELLQTAELIKTEAEQVEPDQGKLAQWLNALFRGVTKATESVASESLAALGQAALGG